MFDSNHSSILMHTGCSILIRSKLVCRIPRMIPGTINVTLWITLLYEYRFAHVMGRLSVNCMLKLYVEPQAHMYILISCKDMIIKMFINGCVLCLCITTSLWWRHQMETFSVSLAFVRGIHRSPVNSPHKGQWRGALMFSLICAWINCWVNNREAVDLRRHRAHYDVIVMKYTSNHVHTKPHSSTLYSKMTSLFRRRSKKTPKLRVTGLCAGNSPVTSEFPA